jgi:hypothetical protein
MPARGARQGLVFRVYECLLEGEAQSGSKLVGMAIATLCDREGRNREEKFPSSTIADGSGPGAPLGLSSENRKELAAAMRVSAMQRPAAS